MRPLETVNDEVRDWGAPIPDWDQNINMHKIAKMQRKAQPGIIFADRTVHGPYENYQTPERSIPNTKLDNPWENCITLGNNWSYVPNDEYKSATKVIHSIIEIVAKGGNLLLGVGPQPDGIMPLEAVKKLEEIGTWLSKNGEAIYGPRTTDTDGINFFTTKEEKLYALIPLKED
ncbi:alpha-L-fucosidase [Maribacter arcticus]|uniref:alpha-L-fucosidase n=1 Tax=Maribacter arcticus TaxID=561365 RepID=UPI003001C9B5